MTDLAVVATRRRSRESTRVAPLLIVSSLIAYCAAAAATGQVAQISVDGFIGVLQRSVALGIVALGQTMAILVGSIDLSVGTTAACETKKTNL